MPDSLEFITLINELGLRVSKFVISKDTTDVVADVGNYLKSTTGWNNNGNGSDLAGFSAIPGGGTLYLMYIIVFLVVDIDFSV